MVIQLRKLMCSFHIETHLLEYTKMKPQAREVTIHSEYNLYNLTRDYSGLMKAMDKKKENK